MVQLGAASSALPKIISAPEMYMKEKMVTVRNSLGLHARPAATIVKAANQFTSNIYLQKGLMKVNAKSIMGVMMLAAGKGTQLTVSADGPDEEEALIELAQLVESDFSEKR
jgi:phosphotransferase system HPr (HPr) family protein